MARVIQAGEFFVVGGPVQPERPCYVERTADQVLETSIRAQRFSFVLGPRAIGKSSLMGRVIKALRRENELAAVVDLAQIQARGDDADAGRWHYTIAHRIVHELRLKVDLSTWWTENNALTGERQLAQFFWEIVLTNTTHPVTIFFDEIDRAQGLPFATELFAAIRACYKRRAAEPDYARLNFVVLGVSSPELLCPQTRDSPFPDGQAVQLEDFDAAQSYQLALGFGGEPAQAQALMDRICVWTNGHPYLTQKVARGVARKGGRLEDVERVVKDQLLTQSSVHDEPLLNHVHGVLAERTPRARQARRLLRKLAKGADVRAQPAPAGLAFLMLAGAVSVSREGRVQYRNRIFKEAFGKRWIKAAQPAALRIAAASIAFVAVAGAAAFWYVEYLPRPYLEALSVETEDFARIEAAYEKLRGLPGFARRADTLFAAAVNRRSDRAVTFAEAMAADDALRNVLDRAELADQLLAQFWLRQSVQAAHAELRDDALLYALQALPREGARAALAELIGDDYPHLERRLQWPDASAHWAVDWPQLRVVGIDPARRVQRLDLEAASSAAAESDAASADPITVLEYRPVIRDLTVTQAGSAGPFELNVDLQHPASGELLLTLTAPSGAQTSVVLPQRQGEPKFSFVAAGSSGLAALADEDREGRWQLALIDRRTENRGSLLGWALRFGVDGEPWRDEPEGAIAIPDAVRTSDVNIQIGANGRFAIASAARPGPAGALALWNLRDGALQTDVPLPAPAQYAELSSDSTRLLVVAGDALIVCNATDGIPVARLATQTEFLLPPALAPDGDYVVIAERVDGAAPLFSLVRTANGELVTSFEGIDGVREWVLGPQARYLALLGAGGVVHVMNPRRGEQLPPLRHVRAVRRMLRLGGGDSLLTVDAAGDVRVWPLGAEAETAPMILGTTTDPQSLSAATGAGIVAYAAAGNRVEIRDADAKRMRSLRVEPAEGATMTRLSPDGGVLVTGAGLQFALWRWSDDGLPAAVEAAAMPEVSAIALDQQGGVLAVGFRGGYVRAQNVADLSHTVLALDGLDHIGHRGGVRSLAVHAAQGSIVSGGNDGAIRVWDIASMVPAASTMRHPTGPVHAVALSNDARTIASAGASSIRLWRIGGEAPSADIAVDATVLGLDFSADDQLLAVGDAAGQVQFRSTADGTPVGEAHAFGHPVRWLDFSADGSSLFVATDHWLHRLNIEAGRLHAAQSRLLASGLEPLASIAQRPRVRVVGGLGSAELDFFELTMDASMLPPLVADSTQLSRDWSEVLGRRVDADGEIVPIPR